MVTFFRHCRIGHFTLKFWRGRQRNLQKSYNARAEPLFCSLNLLFGDLPPSRCRRDFLKLPTEVWQVTHAYFFCRCSRSIVAKMVEFQRPTRCGSKAGSQFSLSCRVLSTGASWMWEQGMLIFDLPNMSFGFRFLEVSFTMVPDTFLAWVK